MVQQKDENLEECGIEELYGGVAKLPQTKPIWESKVSGIKRRLEEVYRTDPDEFSLRKRIIEQAIKERERGVQKTMPELTLDELKDILKSANRLYI